MSPITYPYGTRPLVGISCCLRTISDAPYHAVFEKYITAVTDYANCDVALIPALGSLSSGGKLDLDGLLERFDGLLLTGSLSMVDPSFYGAPPSQPGTRHDTQRDSTTIPLIRRAAKVGVPIFAICRGLQELCCAFGGTLDQDLSLREGEIDHRAPQGIPQPEKYRPAHLVRCSPGGTLSALAQASGQAPDRLAVNSLHVQGIATLGNDLAIEATSPDGLIEAVRVLSSRTFAVGVQWHPEWYVEENPLNRMLFHTFGDACANRLADRKHKMASTCN